MAEPDRTSTGVDRRLSTRVSLQQDDSDEDVYALAALGMSSGGYRPNEQTASQPRGPSQPRRQTPPPRPSSISKPRYDSFALQHDGAMGTLPTRNSTVASSSSAMPSIRPSSTASEVPVIRPESPYQGPSAPSHPYQMYPQQSRLARTASVVTTSTAAVSEMSYAGPSAPTHPYGMYPQNIVPEADVQPLQPAVVIPPVGFPGRNNNYQRRIGPDGEEIGDIIGPDGHTEQLPPYTQYADEALVRKTRPNVQIPVAGAGGMGLATRNPEFASRENLNSPLSAQSIQSAAPSIMSERRLDTTPQEASEKPKELKKWQKVARRKVCGIIPIWVFVLIAVCFLLFAIILAAVFTALKPPHKDKKPQGSHDSGNSNKQPQEIEITTTTTLDAAPFTVFPTSLPTLPTGTYALPITVPSVAPSSCIVDSTQSGAWSCMIQPALPYQFSISGTLDPNPLFNNQIKLGYGNRTVDYLVYGAQPPVLYQHRSLRLVNDSQSPDRGPAWFFQMRYDKVVILPGPTLLTSTVSRRGGAKAERGRPGEYSSGFSGRKGVAQPGEKPWFCYWNGTLLEAFIYVNQTSRAGAGSGTAAASSNYPQMTTGPSYASNTNVPPSSSTSNYPPPWATGAGDPQFLPLFPKVLKLEERRIPVEDQIPPYCVQNIVNADGTFQPLLNSTGLPTTLYLNETTPLSKSTMQGKRITFADISARDYIDEQDDLLEEEPYLLEKREDNVCGCVWISQ